MSEENDFKMHYAGIECPVCGQSNYMRFLQGKNVGEFDMKCLNCNHYFMSKNFPQIGQPAEDVPDTNVGDTIYRKDAINAVEFGITYAKAFNTETGEWKELFEESNEELREAVKRLRDLPPAQPVRGHWIDKGMDGDWQFQTDGRGNCWKVYECSECGKTVKNKYPYCPHCGANMRTTKQIMHEAIDNTPWAEDVYPNIKEELHRIVDAVEE